MRDFAVSASIFLAALPITALAAQTATPREPAMETVITGQGAAEARKEAHSYIRELGVLSSDRPVARWVDPICPSARGISKEHAAFVERQIRVTAEAAGAPVAEENCVANFVVIFTEDAQSLVRLVSKRERSRLAGRGFAPVPELERGEAPILWWYETEARANSGLRAGRDPTPGAKVTNGDAEVPLPGTSSTTVTQHYNASSVSTATIRAIHSATIVIDVNRSAGNRLRSLIDYAALVGLAEIDFGSSPSGSILSLFSGAEGHQALTQQDRVFLSGLYRIPLDRRLTTQRSRLVTEMVRNARSSDE